MSDTQRTIAGYKSKVSEGTDYENPNEGKQVLNDSDEYILRLMELPHVRTFKQIKERKDGSKIDIDVEKAICRFEEQNTKNIVTAFFRIDTLNFSEEEAYESGIIKFFRKIKHPLVDGVEPNWDQYFVVGMRFRSRVVIGKGQDKKPNGNYYLDVPTCRPLLPSDKTDGSVQSAIESNAKAPLLGNALLIAHGCANSTDAWQRLVASKCPQDVLQAFLDADKDGKITYPI